MIPSIVSFIIDEDRIHEYKEDSVVPGEETMLIIPSLIGNDIKKFKEYFEIETEEVLSSSQVAKKYRERNGYEISYTFTKQCFSTVPLIDIFLTQLLINARWNLDLLSKAISFKERIEKRVPNSVVFAIEFCPNDDEGIFILEEEGCDSDKDDFYTNRCIRIFVLDAALKNLKDVRNIDDFELLIDETLLNAMKKVGICRETPIPYVSLSDKVLLYSYNQNLAFSQRNLVCHSISIMNPAFFTHCSVKE